MKCIRIISVVFILLLVSNIILSVDVTACKDIVACGDATGGDYNLLLKVRDPSRPGLQGLEPDTHLLCAPNRSYVGIMR